MDAHLRWSVPMLVAAVVILGIRHGFTLFTTAGSVFCAAGLACVYIRRARA